MTTSRPRRPWPDGDGERKEVAAMEALRLIKTARHALAEARHVPDVLAEARQAALLTEAVGARLAELDDEELAGLGRQLSEAGAHASVCLDRSVVRAAVLSGGRVRGLAELGELGPTLGALDGLLRELGETLVVLACGADTEGLYWTCIDAVDAVAECKDLAVRLREAAGTALGGVEAEPAGRGAPLLVVRLGPPGEAQAPDYRLPGATEASEVSVPAG
ncbi:hypothetical protein F7Q99_08070 [Streptomyces kaniharaensis]|uniref:Uncharacterized protein n=1 Tax=Streptomyces kaniharaensis TaxID=212423 RepID=A0A6N7KL51_9ACTN|nr:DUF6099 family protein [Streptomyces kaniharaensis]MQS12250.1 hypothetical protein [Streptomyces kaniharaensis]